MKEMVKRGFGSPLLPGYRNGSARRWCWQTIGCRSSRSDGLLPPGVRKGQQFDVRVSVLPRANDHEPGRRTAVPDGSGTTAPTRTTPSTRSMSTARQGDRVRRIPPTHCNAARRPTGRPGRALRTGIIMDGGVATADRPIFLRLRQPQASVSRAIEQRIISRFGQEHGVASAHDEGIIAGLSFRRRTEQLAAFHRAWCCTRT